MSIFPNPSKGDLTLKIFSTTEQEGVIKVTDGIGRVVLTQSVNLVEGSNQYNFDLNSSAKGIYLIELKSQSDRILKRWMLE